MGEIVKIYARSKVFGALASSGSKPMRLKVFKGIVRMLCIVVGELLLHSVKISVWCLLSSELIKKGKC